MLALNWENNDSKQKNPQGVVPTFMLAHLSFSPKNSHTENISRHYILNFNYFGLFIPHNNIHQ